MFLRLWIAAAIISLVCGNPELPKDKTGGADNSETPSEQNDKKGKMWAVLVAGSYQYKNYRHQADVCHAYQIFRRHGIPDQNIIVMMYDDIASNPQNPIPGAIFNSPDGPNVYENMLKDYTKTDVTAQNFLYIITGNKSAMNGIGSGKVLESGPNDHVFITFVDRGTTGFLLFPNDTLSAPDLNKALVKMHKNKMYKKLIFYVESSYAGSEFERFLSPKLNILAITASKPDEQSYATYYNETLEAYLGDMFSVSWMEDIDYEEHKNLTTETVNTQYNNVVERLYWYSTPTKYGKMNIAEDHVTDFFGKDKKKIDQTNADRNFNRRPSTREADKDVVPSQDVVLHILQKKIEKNENPEEKRKLETELNALLKGRREIESLFERIISHLPKAYIDAISESPKPLTREAFPCYKTLIDSFNRECVNINRSTFTLRHLYKFANICTTDDSLMGQVLEAFKLECSRPDSYDNID